MTRRIQPDSDAVDVLLSPGEMLEVALPAQTGGGYQWTVEPFPAGTVESAGASYSTPGAAPESASGTGLGTPLGSSQLQSLWFKATARGEVAIDLRYGRVWEGEAGVQRRCRLKLRVQ